MTPSRSPADHLPLTAPFYHVLLALGDEAMHGYGIIQAFEALTNGRETLLPGSLYATLNRMVAAGMVAPAATPPAVQSGGPKRRYYRTTAFGKAVARAESERLARLLDAARLRRLATDGPR